MNLTVQNINFKGYDAAPLKNIYLEESYCAPFIDEMKSIAKKEGFEIKTAYDNDQWIQDDKTIIERDSKPFLIANGDVSDNFIGELKRNGIEGERVRGFLSGGDTFIGKYPDGEKWLLTGEKIGIVIGKQTVSDAYGIDEKNIYTLPKQNYHLDTFIRPIGYPYVLVNDFSLVDKNIEKLDDGSEEFYTYKFNYQRFKHRLDEQYLGINTVCNSLVARGFIPIKIAGVYGGEVNFLNAIVNKHQDNSISYITNSSDANSSNFYKKMQEMFKKDLQEKVPNLSEVYFVKGKNEKYSEPLNYMMGTLKHQGGGLHCMSLEEPNFEAWA